MPEWLKPRSPPSNQSNTPNKPSTLTKHNLGLISKQIFQFEMLFFKEFSESMARLDAGKAPITDFQRFHFATLDWKLPFAVAAAYALIVTIWGHLNKKMAAASNGKSASFGSSTLFKAVVVGHNVLLTVFSAYCFVCMSSLLIKSYTTRTLFDAVS